MLEISLGILLGGLGIWLTLGVFGVIMGLWLDRLYFNSSLFWMILMGPFSILVAIT